MKKFIFIFLTIFSFFIIKDNVYAADWSGVNWASTAPTFTDYFELDSDTGQGRYSSSPGVFINNFPIKGYANGKNYVFGSMMDYPQNMGWIYDNTGWCSGQDWTFKGRLSANGNPSFFSNMSSIRVTMETDNKSYTCTTSSFYDNSIGLWSIDFACSGSATNRYKLLVSFDSYYSTTATIVNLSNYGSEQVSNFACSMSTTDALNNIVATSTQNTKDIINNQKQNTQQILDSQYANSQNEIYNANQNQTQTNNRLDNINDSLTNDSIPDDNSSQANEWSNANASDSVVSDMVLMPITLLNAFYSGFNGTCQSYNLGSFYGTNLSFPCINVSNYLGSTLWGIIDVLMSGFLIYGIGKKFVKVFNDFTNLKDSQVDELYGGGSE